ncbi:MAG: penicillin-binding protein activator [Oceanococcus sp.]
MIPKFSYPSRLTPTLLLAGILGLSACANQAITRGANSPSGPSNTQGAIEDVDYIQLAVMALDSAAASEGFQRIIYLEDACWASARAEQADLLNQALTLYPEIALSPEQTANRAAYQALLSAMQDDAQTALAIISANPRPNQARPLTDYWLAYAMAYRLLDDGAAATLMLVRRDGELDATQRDANWQRIWNLQLESARFLFRDDSIRYDATTQGWLELGRIARQFWTDEQDIQNALQQWNFDFPGHPAALDFWQHAQVLAYNTLNSAVRKIALLLPVSGRLKEAAAAVRDGFISAHFADVTSSLEIRIYDTAENPRAAYDRALAEGAELMVGPLDKQQVEIVVQYNANRVPLLTLNYRDQSDPSASVLEFGLAPEDEARSAATQALNDGLSHAIVLASDNDFGRRSLQAFQNSFTSAGGTLLDTRMFSGTPRDYQNTIKSLLKLEESAARFAAIQRLIGEELDSAPVRRQDAQFVFLAATPQEGRQIRPQLKFYHAEDLPIYSGGRIYAGQPDPRQDKDLNGVRFCAMPWLLGSSELWRSRREAVEQAWPERAKRFERLYAMGNDAYLLASTLRNTNWTNLPVIAGATGQLRRQQSRIVRSLPCTRFVGGIPDRRVPVINPQNS